MEKTIEQMERELRAAKLRQKYDALLEHFHKAKEEYEGKSFGNRRMTYGCLRKYKLESEVCMHHINNVYISTNSYSSDVINTFDVNFPGFVKEACENCNGGMYAVTWNIFKNLIGQVAQRATELHDPVLDALMIKLNLYELPNEERRKMISKLQQIYKEQVN